RESSRALNSFRRRSCRILHVKGDGPVPCQVHAYISTLSECSSEVAGGIASNPVSRPLTRDPSTSASRELYPSCTTVGVNAAIRPVDHQPARKRCVEFPHSTWRKRAIECPVGNIVCLPCPQSTRAGRDDVSVTVGRSCRRDRCRHVDNVRLK